MLALTAQPFQRDLPPLRAPFVGCIRLGRGACQLPERVLTEACPALQAWERWVKKAFHPSELKKICVYLGLFYRPTDCTDEAVVTTESVKPASLNADHCRNVKGCSS